MYTEGVYVMTFITDKILAYLIENTSIEDFFGASL